MREPTLADLDTPELRDAFAREVVDVNRRRLRVIGPIMIGVHLIHVWVFWVSAAQRAALTLPALHWHEDHVWAHGVMVPITGALTLLVFRARYDFIARFMGPVVAGLYLVHGAVCTSIDQITAPNATAYVSYCLGMAVIICMRPRDAVTAYGVGLSTLVIGMLVVEPAVFAQLPTLPTGGTITMVGVALSWALYTARRREFRQHLTIERQRDQLSSLNTGLELRVKEQVDEIVARATEVERLNAQLQAQVRARSSELSIALARLARERGDGGALRRGTVLGERFIVEELIGEGGMGAVFSGVDRTTGARVAIKVVQATSSRTLDALRRFVREAGAAAAVTHPAVVRMLNVDISDDGLLFQVQELIDGQSLGRLAKRSWNALDAARLGAVLCDALAAAHAVGVVHRDVKPDNMMLTTSAPGLKLLDFGIAKLYDAVSRVDDAMTSTGMIVGTPAYMAPEQVRGAGEVSDRADVYAAGVILFRLLSERHPFEAATAQETMMNRVLQEAPSVRDFEPSVPEPIASLVGRCLGRAPGDRPSAAAVARELGAWADAEHAPPLEKIAHARCEAAATLATSPRHGAAT